MTDWIQWFDTHVGLALGLVAASLATGAITLWAGHRFLVSIPADYFTRPHNALEKWREPRSTWQWVLLVAKNVFGSLLLVAGVAMLVLPGQGILSILLSLSLLDVPGKRSLEAWLIARPRVLPVVNRIRASANQPPLATH